MKFFVVSFHRFYSLTIILFVITCNVFSAEIISASKNSYCHNESLIIQSAFVDTINYSTVWEYSLNELDWYNVTLLNANKVVFASRVELNNLKDISNFTIRARYTNINSNVDSLSNQITITVYQPLIAGAITIGGFKTDTICYNTAPKQLSISQPASGGNGTFTYQWQFSTNGTVWQNQSAATQTSFNPTSLTTSHYYRMQYSTSCGIVYSDTVQAVVWSDLVKAEIGSNQTICWNTIPVEITTTKQPTGGNSKFGYQWQVLQGSTWADISGAITPSYQPAALHQTTQYRLKNTSLFGCGVIYSDPITITVYAKLQAGAITGNQSICYNTAATPITFSTVPVGGGNSYSYQWLESSNGVTYSAISNATNNVYQTPSLTSNRYYKVAVISKLGCSSDTTNAVLVTVYQPLIAGEITIGGFKTDTICYNTSPKQLSISQPASGGNGTFTYQWQFSTNGTVWQNQSGATQTSFSPSNLTASRYYRMQFSTSCGVVYSDTVQAVVWSDLVKAEIGSSQTICWNTIPVEITTTKQPTGGNSKFGYQWQVLQGTTWADISGAITPSYQPAALQQTTQYRLKNTSLFGCGVVYSNPITITVYAKLQAGVIIGNQSICYNTAATPIAFSTVPAGGGNSYSYQWLESSNGVTYNAISNATNNVYQTPSLTSNRYYKVAVISKLGCSSDTTNAVLITVYQPLIAGTITIGGFKTDTICYNTAPKQLSISQPASGGNGTFTYQWQFSTNGTVWQNQSGATQTSFSPSNLTASRYYRMQFSTSCGIVYSDTVQAIVWSDLVKAEIGSSQTICWNTIPMEITTTKQPTGGNSKFGYQWQVLQGTTWADISGAITPSYQPAALQQTTQYRLKNTSLFGCGVVYSNPITITVYAKLQAGAIIGNQSICYNTAATPIAFSTVPAGGGNSYSYQWLESSNGVTYNAISNATNNVYQTPSLTSNRYYKVAVISKLGCSSDTTNAVLITVYQPLIAGTITIGGFKTDTICYNTSPKQLSISQPASGGNGTFTYQWQFSTNGTVWQNQSGATQTSFSPSNLTATRYYRMQFSSTCDVVYSDVIEVYVNPLPTEKIIKGDFTVCANQKDNIYKIDNPQEGIVYEWSVIGGVIGKVLHQNKTTISVDWGINSGNAYLVLYQTNALTGCRRDSSYLVTITTNIAPNKTVVNRKSTSNLLFCQEANDGITYRWGYVNKNNGDLTYLQDSNQRYIMLPHNFDASIYDYFVETMYTYPTQTCATRSFFVIEEEMRKNNIDGLEISLYPNPVTEVLNVEFSSTNKNHLQTSTLEVLDIRGQVLWTKSYSREMLMSTISIPIAFGKGVYLLQIKVGTDILTRKFVVR